MKKLLFVCALLTASSTLFAQKYAVIDANQKLTDACRDAQNIDYRLVNQAWKDIQECMVHEKSKDYYDTWRVAAKIKNILTFKLYQDGQTNGLDTLQYFTGLSDILGFYSKYEKCLTTPNEKGKLPVKPADYKELHKEAQAEAYSLRENILSGAQAILN